MTHSISVLLVDDHAVVRTGYRQLLAHADGVNKVIEAETGEQACQRYVEHQPAVVVMDLSLPGIGGLASIRRIVARDATAKILVFSIHDETVYVTRAMEAGAKGYITKSSSPELLVDAVRRVARGEIVLEPGIAQRIAVEKLTGSETAPLALLSAREFEVFCLIAKGFTSQEAADELRLSFKTVANYNTLIKSKLSVKTNSELTRLAYRHGLFKDLGH